MTTTPKPSGDVFAAMAAKRVAYRDASLVEPLAPVLPSVELTVEAVAAPSFTPLKKMDTEQELQAELAVFRRRYAPFLQDVAPAAAVQTRHSQPLTRFDWRVQSEADVRDFQAALQGAGAWEQVTVPHYGGPLGLAATLYRTTFRISVADLTVGRAFVCFKGADYKAHVFMNGNYLGSHEGFFAPFRLDFTDCARAGENTLVVRVENDYICMGSDSPAGQHGGDKLYAATGLGYDDPEFGWHHCPPGMGIYQDVRVELCADTFIDDLFVRPLPDEHRAEVVVDVFKCLPGAEARRFRLSLYGANFRETVLEGVVHTPSVVKQCGLNDDYQVALAKADGTYQKPIPLLVEKGLNSFTLDVPMSAFRWWRPEEPYLYLLRVELLDETGAVIDVADRRFGMRTFRMDESSHPMGALLLNGKPIRLRGANTMGHEQQCVFREDWDQLRDDLLLAKIGGMNFLRLTQRPVQPEVYDYCDRLGLLVQTDLPNFAVIRRNQYAEVLRQAGEMERLIRSHPSCVLVTYINEPTPNGNNQPHRQLSRSELEALFRAADDIVHLQNPDRVIKACDGDYDPPGPGISDRHCYPCWYNGHGIDIGRLHKGDWQAVKPGWYFGCGEFGAEGLECADLMRRRYPKDWLPQTAEEEATWNPGKIRQAQTGSFHRFFFDTPDALEGWVQASQEHQARSTRIMTEAFRRMNGMNTFAIHLFIDAFPSGWMKAIMDCERRPKPAFFAYRNALAPVLPTLRTDRTRLFAGDPLRLEAWISNDTGQALQGGEIRYQFECGGEVFAAGRAPALVDGWSSRFHGWITAVAPRFTQRAVVTARLAVMDASGIVINDNAVEIEVFPEGEPLSGIRVGVLGGKDGIAARLARELGLAIRTDGALDECTVILIDDVAAYQSNAKAVDAAVQRGARAIFLELPPGTCDIAGSRVAVKESQFSPLHFASRATGHPLVAGFAPHDFSRWYDPAQDFIAPLLLTTFTADGFAPVLTGANTDSAGAWGWAMAVGAKALGAGQIVVCQVKLAGRTTTNPPAALFAQRLIGTRHSDSITTKGS
jgi:hypothetical protein